MTVLDKIRRKVCELIYIGLLILYAELIVDGKSVRESLRLALTHRWTNWSKR